MYNVRSTACARLSLSLFGAPPQKISKHAPKKISALSLSFLLRIFSGAAKAPWRPAPERIRSKNERLSAQSFTRRYEMVRNTVTDRAPRAFKGGGGGGGVGPEEEGEEEGDGRKMWAAREREGEVPS